MIGLWLAGLAWSSPEYPQVLADEVGVDCPPPCTVCHDSLLGGTGSVVSAFGAELQARGLQAGNRFALQELVAQLAADGHDSDRDGLADVDALTEGLDPSTGERFCEPASGCASAPGGGAAGGAGGLLALLLQALRARRRGSRRSRTRSPGARAAGR